MIKLSPSSLIEKKIIMEKIIRTVDEQQMKVAVMNINQPVAQKKLVVTQSNALAKSVQKMTLQEKRLLLLVIAHVRQNDDDFLLYRIPIKHIKEYLGANDTGFHDYIRETTRKLLGRVVEIENEDGGWEQFQWVSYCRYYSKKESEMGDACLEIRFHDCLRPFLLHLKKYFNSFRLLQIAAMPSFNSVRVYEILFSASNNFTKIEIHLTVNDLKKRLGFERKYTNFKDFRRDILERAQRDCAKYSPLTFTWQEQKKGRKIVNLRFKVKKNSKFKGEPVPIPQIEQPLQAPKREKPHSKMKIQETTTTLTVEQNQVLSLLKENDVNKTTAEKLTKEFSLQRIIKNVELARQKHKTGKTKDLGGVTVVAIREDWSNIATTPSPLEPVKVKNEKKRQIQAANEHRAQKEKRLEDLKSAFYKERRQRVSEIMTSWDEETFKAELADFEKTTDSVTRGRCKKSGLDSRLVKAAFDKYVAEKYLNSAENDFVIWVSRRGYEVEGSDNGGGYRVRPVRSIGAVLGDIMQKMDGISGFNAI
jgi:plasmid replication initiation protein